MGQSRKTEIQARLEELATMELTHEVLTEEEDLVAELQELDTITADDHHDPYDDRDPDPDE